MGNQSSSSQDSGWNIKKQKIIIAASVSSAVILIIIIAIVVALTSQGGPGQMCEKGFTGYPDCSKSE